MKIYILCFRVKISSIYNFEVKRWKGGAVGLIVGTSSRMWPPEARTDNFFTRPNAMPRMRDNAMHYNEMHFFSCIVMLSTTVLPNPFQYERPKFSYLYACPEESQ